MAGLPIRAQLRRQRRVLLALLAAGAMLGATLEPSEGSVTSVTGTLSEARDTPVAGTPSETTRKAAKALNVPIQCVHEVYGTRTEGLDTPVAAPKSKATILVRGMWFSPCGVVVPAGSTVTMTIKNVDSRVHSNFVIDELDVRTGNIAPGESMEVLLDAPPGTYVFYSSYAGHRQAGRAGILVVVHDGSAEASASEATPPAATANAEESDPAPIEPNPRREVRGSPAATPPSAPSSPVPITSTPSPTAAAPSSSATPPPATPSPPPPASPSSATSSTTT